ncbi:MAG: hypothetical protein ACREX3_14675 [Gammaproteobacteria bacterium]
MTDLSGSVRGEALPGLFILWTILALPLYVITAWGLPAPPEHHGAIAPLQLGALFWAVLIIGAFSAIFVQDPFDRVAGFTAFIWTPAPFVLALIALVTTWRRTSSETRHAGGLTRA